MLVLSMKYVLSSGNELWCGVVGGEGRVKGGMERERRSGGERMGQVTIVDSFVAGFLCVGAGELPTSCSRHD